MKLIKIIGLFCLFCITFFYTEKVINVSTNQDEIMISIKNVAKNNYTSPTDAIITNDTIIPGNVGKYIDTEASYKAMKKINYYEPSLLIYKEIYPEISIYNNYNKYIIRGNTSKKNVSLIYILNNNTLDSILDIQKHYNISIAIFVSSSFLNQNINIIDKIKDNEIYNYGNNGKYTKDNLIIANNIINNKANNKAKFCLFLTKDKESIDNCANSKMFSILPKTNISYFNIKDNLENGSILLINNTKELNSIIEFIISKGYNIVPLTEIITE